MDKPHTLAALRQGESTGRPVGSARFLAEVKASLGRDPRKAKRGRKSRSDNELSALSP